MPPLERAVGSEYYSRPIDLFNTRYEAMGKSLLEEAWLLRRNTILYSILSKEVTYRWGNGKLESVIAFEYFFPYYHI